MTLPPYTFTVIGALIFVVLLTLALLGKKKGSSTDAGVSDTDSDGGGDGGD